MTGASEPLTIKKGEIMGGKEREERKEGVEERERE